ncbi:MAG: DUF2232 domain-containing protein [Gammaproteobacteria bacterium]|nr:MAG: DUF2232 domain-containing protein [Gammaproteobacteria bacterium]
MRALAAWIMQGRLQAVLVVSLATVAAFLLPPLTSPLSYLGSAAIALVTLRRGGREGFAVLALALVAVTLAGQLAAGVGLWMAVTGALFWLPVWAAAWVLRASVSWPLTLVGLTAAGLGILAVLYLALGDPAEAWLHLLQRWMAGLPAESRTAALERVVQLMARWMSVLLVAAFETGVLLSLFLGRGWQAMLYNPGGLAREFERLRLGRSAALATLGMGALAALTRGGFAAWARDATLLLGLAWAVQGLAVVHAIRRRRGLHRGWLVLLYVLVLVAEPHAAFVLALLGWSDSWIDFRNRGVRRPGGDSEER